MALILCTECKKEISDKDATCPHCGCPMEANTEENENETHLNEIRLFVQENSDYYINNWESVSNPEKYAGWNWSAFFAGIIWIAYRKMYKMVAIFWFVSQCFSQAVSN